MAEPEDPFGAPKPPTPYRPGSIAARAWRAGYRHVYTTIRLDPDQPLRSDR